MQLARLLQRGMTEQQAEQRLAAQISADEKAARADFVIRTDGTLAETNCESGGDPRGFGCEDVRT